MKASSVKNQVSFQPATSSSPAPARSSDTSQRSERRRRRGSGLGSTSTTLVFHLLQLLRRARPVFAQQARESPIGQELAPGLTLRTVVAFILRMHDALHLAAAHRARLAEASVHGHAWAESRHLLREGVAGLLAQ